MCSSAQRRCSEELVVVRKVPRARKEKKLAKRREKRGKEKKKRGKEKKKRESEREREGGRERGRELGHMNSSAKENTVGNEDNTIFMEHPVHLQLDLYIVL